MKYFFDKHTIEIAKYVIGKKVWLSIKNLKLKQLARRFSAEWVGPYKILELVRERVVRLKIPHT
jgi:hypothetical protein